MKTSNRETQAEPEVAERSEEHRPTHGRREDKLSVNPNPLSLSRAGGEVVPR